MHLIKVLNTEKVKCACCNKDIYPGREAFVIGKVGDEEVIVCSIKCGTDYYHFFE